MEQAAVNTKISLKQLAGRIAARNNCIKTNNEVWKTTHEEVIDEMMEHLPHGSGIDAGTKFLLEESTPQRLVFSFSYHHMNENGYYDGWTDHKLIITPTFGSYDMKITGRDRNDTKAYLYDLFSEIFTVSE